MLLYPSISPSPHQATHCFYVMDTLNNEKEMAQRTSWPISMRATFSSSPL